MSASTPNPARREQNATRPKRAMRASVFMSAFLPVPPRTANDLARRCASMFSIFDNLPTVNEDLADAGRELMGLLESSVVADRCRVKDNDVCEITGFEPAAAVELQIFRWQ